MHRLRHSIRRLPDAAMIGGAAVSVGATVLAGAITATPPLAIGLNGAAAGGASLAATWLHQRHQANKQQSAVRVLTHLASRPQTAGFSHTSLPPPERIR